MNILTTVLVYVGGPLVVYGGIALLTLVPSRIKKRPKYRPGSTWDYADQWWAGDYPVPAADPALINAGTEGGARGTW